MLFTKTFLRKRVIPDSAIARDLIKAFTQVYVLWVNAKNNGAKWSEEQTEKNFVRPILEILAWSFAVQVKEREFGDITRPDYTLFMDTLSRALGESKGDGSSEYFDRALAIAEAKHWNRALDMRGATQRDTWKANANPDHQMLGYLKTSGVSWGVLTNGSTWRLYHHSISSTATDYYEINLSEIFDGVDPKVSPGVDRLERFFIWWRLFQCGAFVPDGSGLAFVQHILEEYNQYRDALKERMLDRIINQAVPAIAEGILLHRYRKYGKGPGAAIEDSNLSSVTTNLVYRMLFLFVAEHKGLLPVDAQGNQVIGICALANTVVNKQNSVQNIYEVLLNLFKTVYFGAKQSHIPACRGELYNPSSPELVFLADHTISNPLIQKVFEALTVDGGKAVDFECFDSDLLADIAETLLDVSIHFVELPFDRRDLKARIVRPESQTMGEASIKHVNSPIDYLIHQTLKSVLDEKERHFISAMEDIVAIRTTLSGTEQVQSSGELSNQLRKANENALAALLGFRILDPCMKTGRCLIGVVQYLTKEIIYRMQKYHDLHPAIHWDWNPVYVLLDQERQRSLARMSRYGLEVKSSEFGDTQLLKRIISLKCIFGVEDDPVTAAVAKHNIWLSSFSVGSPFSFLDFHLRQGNAIMGTLVRDDYGPESKQMQNILATGVSKALNKLSGMKALLFTGRLDTKQYEIFNNAIQPYLLWLNLSVLESLGDTSARAIIRQHKLDIESLNRRPEVKNMTVGREFFHWDLEFPEVFVEEISHSPVEEAGFDAVICIPDSTFSVREGTVEALFLQTRFPAVGSLHNPNWYHFAQGLRLLSRSGYIAMIINRRAFVTRRDPLQQVISRLMKNAV